MPPEPDNFLPDAPGDDAWTGETDSRQDGVALARMALNAFRDGQPVFSINMADAGEVTLDFALGFAERIWLEAQWMSRGVVRFANVGACAGIEHLREQLARFDEDEWLATRGIPKPERTNCADPVAARQRLRAKRAAKPKKGGLD